jgi:hypothetical protein
MPSTYSGGVQIVCDMLRFNRAPCSGFCNLALVVARYDSEGYETTSFYRASTCLTLDMAYNNARLLARPDRDWLQP